MYNYIYVIATNNLTQKDLLVVVDAIYNVYYIIIYML